VQNYAPGDNIYLWGGKKSVHSFLSLG
jgi:uncharacterized protein (DUF2235 family)